MTSPAPILYVNHVARIGGAEVGLLDMLALLDRERFAPAAALPGAGPLADEIRRLAIPVWPLPLARLTRRASPLARLALLAHGLAIVPRLAIRLRHEKIALVHANSATAQLYAAPAARLAGIPAVWHCRDLVPLGRLARWLDRLSARTIATSQAVADSLQAQGVAAHRIRLIPNGTRTGAWTAPPDAGSALRREWAVPPDAVLAGMVAQIVPWKRHDLFLDAVAHAARVCPALMAVIVGDDLFGDHPGALDRLRSQAQALGIASRLRIAGYRTDMPAVYAALDILAHPAGREPFGRVLVEAMAAGRPVVAVDDAGPREIVADGSTGILVPPGDARAFGDALARLASDRAAREAFGHAGQARVRERFDARRMVRDIESLYSEVLHPS